MDNSIDHPTIKPFHKKTVDGFNGKMFDVSKMDTLHLLGFLEFELQAHDKNIATLKAEKAKHFLYKAKYGEFGLEGLPTLDGEGSGLNPLTQLDILIKTQQESQSQMQLQFDALSSKFHMICCELKTQHSKQTLELEQGDIVASSIFYDIDRLKDEVDTQQVINCKLERELKSKNDKMTALSVQRQIINRLLKRRKEITKNLECASENAHQIELKISEEKRMTQEIETRLSEQQKHSADIELKLSLQLSQRAEECQHLRHLLCTVVMNNRDMENFTEREDIQEIHSPTSCINVTNSSSSQAVLVEKKLNKIPQLKQQQLSKISVPNTSPNNKSLNVRQPFDAKKVVKTPPNEMNQDSKIQSLRKSNVPIPRNPPPIPPNKPQVRLNTTCIVRPTVTKNVSIKTVTDQQWCHISVPTQTSQSSQSNSRLNLSVEPTNASSQVSFC